MTGRQGSLLLLALLAFGGVARADDATPAPSPPPPATATPDNTAPPPPSDAAAVPVPLPSPPTDTASPPADASSAPAPAASTPDAPKDQPPEAPKDTPKQAPKDVAQPPKNLEPIPKEVAITVLGKKVLGPSGEDMGRVTDLLLDRDAHIKSIVIDFGGFLGVGSRKIAIDWRLVRFVPDDKDAPIALSLGKAEVQAAPEYKDGAQPPVMVGPPPSGPDAAR